MTYTELNNLVKKINAFTLAPKPVQESVISGVKAPDVDPRTYAVLRNSLKDIQVSARDIADGVSVPGLIALGVALGIWIDRK